MTEEEYLNVRNLSVISAAVQGLGSCAFGEDSGHWKLVREANAKLISVRNQLHKMIEIRDAES